jgi:tocopherol O-methyltransferase
MATETYHKEIIRYYNSSQKDYEIIWGTKKHRSLHYGFWDAQTKTHEQAINNMTEQVSLAANLSSEKNVADLGCGIGGPAFYLAKKYNCTVHGISLSEKQIAQAQQYAIENNLGNTLFFTAGDYCDTPYPSNNFDVVYAIESSCHAAQKIDFLKEAYRILKPGGKLIVLDFFWTGNEKSEQDKKVMQQWCSSWAIENMAYQKQFLQDYTTVGFTKITAKNITQNILPSIKRLNYFFYPALFFDTCLRLIGNRKGKHQNMYSALYQYKAYKRGLWEYYIFEGVK